MIHKHHIHPKHAGGDPKGPQVELTVEEHAKAHRDLWLRDGNKYDYIAWRALSGQITSDEARREAASLVLKEKWKDPIWKEKQIQKIKKSLEGKDTNSGRGQSKLTNPKRANSGVKPGNVPWNKDTNGLQGSGLCNDMKEYQRLYYLQRKSQ